ncbi:UDP-glucose 4-epimerase [Deinococcus phoenicis]|uniref:UDP-glucose 4-epimerase n=1 Tax=Deinococcus phoenicis TaxID=1476583 RepID=A0A016QUL9_9DEIO|nr:UDP-glucose 4-epimerase GalE [Deinococcus phoenicis]EYB69479.1 UDP-glucose 4-epimerase [Deinococcus phoenicis]
MKLLVTGGAGYIGSTVCAALEEAGHVPVVLDSLVTGQAAFTGGWIFYRGDIADAGLLSTIFDEHPDIGATLHFAARIVVSESVAQPGLYYRENVVKSLALFETLAGLGQRRIVFSSSASIYDSPPDLRVTEASPLRPLSPYARSKWMTELILQDLCTASQDSLSPLRGIALRYFNPIGADPQLRSGPYVPDPSHVLGRLIGAWQGRQPAFSVTGTDYPTRDGTGLRDYIHIWDLALAHVAAVERFDQAFERAAAELGQPQVFLPINVGTGSGVTVRELLAAFEEVAGTRLGGQDAPRRPGDSAGACADISRARAWLDWEPQQTTPQALASALAWERQREARLAGAADPGDRESAH